MISFLFRCGLLTFHVRLPYSYLQKPYVESAIRATYHRNICNCTVSDHTAHKSSHAPTWHTSRWLE